MKKSEMRKIPGFKQIKRTEDKHIDYSDDEYDKKQKIRNILSIGTFHIHQRPKPIAR